MNRYKRLATHLIMNKTDPLQLDEFKFAFLQQASSELVSVTVSQLRQVIRLVLNNERHSYEERFIQALVGPESKRLDDTELE